MPEPTDETELDQWKFVFIDIDGTEAIILDYFEGTFDKVDREAKPWTKTQLRELSRHINLKQPFCQFEKHWANRADPVG